MRRDLHGHHFPAHPRSTRAATPDRHRNAQTSEAHATQSARTEKVRRVQQARPATWARQRGLSSGSHRVLVRFVVSAFGGRNRAQHHRFSQVPPPAGWSELRRRKSGRRHDETLADGRRAARGFLDHRTRGRGAGARRRARRVCPPGTTTSAARAAASGAPRTRARAARRRRRGGRERLARRGNTACRRAWRALWQGQWEASRRCAAPARRSAAARAAGGTPGRGAAQAACPACAARAAQPGALPKRGTGGSSPARRVAPVARSRSFSTRAPGGRSGLSGAARRFGEGSSAKGLLGLGGAPRGGGVALRETRVVPHSDRSRASVVQRTSWNTRRHRQEPVPRLRWSNSVDPCSIVVVF